MNIFKQLIVSTYSPKSIAPFRFQGIGKTILYVFLLTLLSIIPTAAYISTALVNGLEVTQQTVYEKLPSFTIENGVLHSEQTKPMTIKENNITIYFDPSGEISADDIDTSGESIAILKNDFAVASEGEVEQFSYSMMDDIKLTKDDISELVSTIDSILPILIAVMILVVYIFSSALKFVEVSVLALIGSILGSASGRTIQYRQLWRLAAYSVTLPTIFFTIMDAFRTTVPFGFVINWLVATIVLYLVLKEIPLPKRKENQGE
jgi:hypothetical protein